MKRFILLFLLGTPLLGQFVSVHPPESTIANFPTCDGSYAGSKLRIATDSADCTSSTSGYVVCWCDAVGPWALVGGGTVGGSDTEVLYNNAGVEDGIASFTFDGTDMTLGTGDLSLSAGNVSVTNANGAAIVTVETMPAQEGTVVVGLDGTSAQLQVNGTVGQADNLVEFDADGDSTITDGGALWDINGDLSQYGNVNIFSGVGRSAIGATTGWSFTADSDSGWGGSGGDLVWSRAGGQYVTAYFDTLTAQDMSATFMDNGSAQQVAIRAGGTQGSNDILVVENAGGATDYLNVTSAGITLATVPHGEMFTNASAAGLTLTTQNVWYEWADATCTAGDNVGMTCSASTDDLIVDTSMGGAYNCQWHVEFTADTNSCITEGTLSIDGTEDTSCYGGRKIGTGADAGSMSGGCTLDIAAAEALALEIRETSGGACDGIVVTPINVNVSCHRVGS